MSEEKTREELEKEAQEIKDIFIGMQGHVDTEEEKELLKIVDEARITLVADNDEEYEYLILDEFENDGKTYLALACCDEKDVPDEGSDLGTMDDITVVRKVTMGDQVAIEAVTDEKELLACARVIEKMFGRLLSNELPEDLR